MDQKIFIDLRNILAKLYLDGQSILRITEDAGIDPSSVTFNSNAKNNWHSVLAEANKSNRIDTLLNVVESEYPTNEPLRNACDAYRKSTRPSELQNLDSIMSADVQKLQSSQNKSRDTYNDPNKYIMQSPGLTEHHVKIIAPVVPEREQRSTSVRSSLTQQSIQSSHFANTNITIRIWLTVLIYPGKSAFIQVQSKSHANFTTAIIWMAISGAVDGILGWVAFNLLFGSSNGLLAMIEQMDLPPETAAQMREMFSNGMMSAFVGGAGLSSIVTTPLFFLIGAGLFYLIGRMLGGQGDLGRYAYLLASFQAPFGIITALLGLVPVLRGLYPLMCIYNLVLTFFATTVGLNLGSGKAMVVIISSVAIVAFPLIYVLWVMLA